MSVLGHCKWYSCLFVVRNFRLLYRKSQVLSSSDEEDSPRSKIPRYEEEEGPLTAEYNKVNTLIAFLPLLFSLCPLLLRSLPPPSTAVFIVCTYSSPGGFTSPEETSV